MILSRIASILQKSFNLKFYDTFPVFLYCFDSYPGRKVELQDCKILAFFNNSSEVLEEKDTSTIHPLAMFYAKPIWQLFVFNQFNNF